MSKYSVWSRHIPEEGEPFDQLETVRTDRKVAEEDAKIFSGIFHRKSWVQDSEEGK